jgi:hypothetical protein
VEPPLGSSILPQWFDANRVQGHTRLTLRKPLPPGFEAAAVGFKRLGADVFTRHVKSADEDPWWPTFKPLDDDGQPHSSRPRVINGVTVEPNDDIAARIIDEAHARGAKIIAYYWDASEATLESTRPEWICREPDRTPIVHWRRGTYLDLTGPYAKQSSRTARAKTRRDRGDAPGGQNRRRDARRGHQPRADWPHRA